MAIEHTYKNYEGKLITKKLTPIKAIRTHCLECLGWSSDEVVKCSLKTCPLYPFRRGHDPSRKRKYSEKERSDMTKQLRLHRKKQELL